MSQDKLNKSGDLSKQNQTSEESTVQKPSSVENTLGKMEEIGNRGNVTCMYGASSENFSVAGQTVATVRDSLKDSFNIPQDAVPFVNGNQVDGTYVLSENDNLEFVKQAGTKGFYRIFVIFS